MKITISIDTLNKILSEEFSDIKESILETVIEHCITESEFVHNEETMSEEEYYNYANSQETLFLESEILECEHYKELVNYIKTKI